MRSLSSHITVSDWLNWLENTRPEQDIDLGLDRIRAVGAELDLLSPAPLVITVAGTNGKGSTIALLEAILKEAGYSVGAFTSPHFFQFNERIRINGEEVSDDFLCDAFATIDSGRGQTWLTYFEFATLAAVHCFQKAKVDIALMEVGLGGRLDATNAINPNISVITTVDLDHQDWLGYSIEAIAKEKAGIMRSEQPAIFGDSNIPKAIIEQSLRLDVPLYRSGVEYQWREYNEGWIWSGHDFSGKPVSYDRLPVPNLVIDNAAAVLQVLQLIECKVSERAIVEGLKQASVAGRYQKSQHVNHRGENVELILDVAHNPQAAKKLKQRLQKEKCAGKTHLVIAMCSDKDYNAVIETLGEMVCHWYVAEFDSPRKLDASILDQRLKNLGCHSKSFNTVEQAVEQALKTADAQDRIVIAGSFMTVAEALTGNPKL